GVGGEGEGAKDTAGQPGRRPITPARHLSRAELIDAGAAADERALTCHHTANKLVEPQAQSSAASWRREKPCPPRHPARSPETARRPASRGAAGLPGRPGSTIPAAAAPWSTRTRARWPGRGGCPGPTG